MLVLPVVLNAGASVADMLEQPRVERLARLALLAQALAHHPAVAVEARPSRSAIAWIIPSPSNQW